jgi:hypothetical protein
LELHTPYRVLSGTDLSYHLPAGTYGLQGTSTGSSFIFYLIHEGAKREESFIYRAAAPVQFAPRFVAEVLTPVVSVTPSERLIVRVTNNSRDGVRDSVYVDDSLATAPKREFRLNTKGAAMLDTLPISWKRPVAEGTYLMNVQVAGRPVAQFATRKIEATLDAKKRVALLTGLDASPTAGALRRLGANWMLVKSGPQLAGVLAGVHVAIVDRRALTLDAELMKHSDVLNEFAQKGGHLIILSQDAGRWNVRPLIPGVTLKRSFSFGEETLVDVESASRIVTSPNAIRREDWSNWLYQLAYNTLEGPALDQALIVARAAKDRSPLIVQWKRGEGTVSYAELALFPQFLNVHEGAYRLLANLVSY